MRYLLFLFFVFVLLNVNAQNGISFFKEVESCIIVNLEKDGSIQSVIDTIYCDDCTIVGNKLFTQSYEKTIDKGTSILLSGYSILDDEIKLNNRKRIKLPAKLSLIDYDFELKGISLQVTFNKYKLIPHKRLNIFLVEDLQDAEKRITEFIDLTAELK